jgi:hypothetical protein
MLKPVIVRTSTHRSVRPHFLTPGYRPAAGSLAEADSCEAAKLLADTLIGALSGPLGAPLSGGASTAAAPGSGIGSGGVVVSSDHGLSRTTVLHQPAWFHHQAAGKGQQEHEMYC